MNKKIASEIAIGIILLLAIIIGGVFYLQNKKNNPQEYPKVFTLKVGEKAIYKGEFNLEIKLVEIGKIGDLFSKGERTEKGKKYDNFSQIVESVECPKNDCTAYNLTNYYVLVIKHQKGNDLGCGAKEESVAISSKGSEIYECPDAYNFEVNPLNSNNEKVEFEINYTPYSFDI